MKYKIKVEVMQDGSSRYYPMVKKHWWSRWENVNSVFPYFSTMQTAKNEIRTFHQAYLRTNIDHTYVIPYKEEE